MYNSKANFNEDDPDNNTIIDPSLVYRSDDKPAGSTVVSRRKNTNKPQSIINPSTYDEKNDYVYIEHGRAEVGEDLMKILEHYRLDLEGNSKDQRECDQTLITRLTDYTRSIVSSDTRKLRDLENLYEKIFDLQDIRFIEQKERQEQLNNEMIHLKKLIITPVNEQSVNNVYQLNSMVNYQQWLELEEETKKLYHLVETQREKITELVQLLTQKGQLSSSDESQQKQQPKHATTKNIDQHRSTGKQCSAVPVSSSVPCSRIRSGTESIICPICKYQLSKDIDEFELDEHIEKCTKSSHNLPSDSDQYKCPVCSMQMPPNDQVYIQHLGQCFNKYNDNY